MEGSEKVRSEEEEEEEKMWIQFAQYIMSSLLAVPLTATG